MAGSYSIDLREKAVSAVERGEKSQVYRTLNISRNTLDLWIKKGEFQESNERRQLRSSYILSLTLNLANIAMAISTMWADLETIFVQRGTDRDFV